MLTLRTLWESDDFGVSRGFFFWKPQKLLGILKRTFVLRHRGNELNLFLENLVPVAMWFLTNISFSRKARLKKQKICFLQTFIDHESSTTNKYLEILLQKIKNVTYFIFSIFLVCRIYKNHVTAIAIPHITFYS